MTDTPAVVPAAAADAAANLIVQSKVREQIRARELRVSDEYLAALNEEVRLLIDRSIKRCLENGRKTVGRADV